jgi:predicted nucleotidyltransferase
MTGRPSLSGDEARGKAERVAALLAADPRVRLAYVYGSAAQPSRPAARDVDLAILTEPRLEGDEILRLAADLSASVGAPIDLLSLNEAPVVLAHEVVEGGTCLFARAAETEVDFVTRTRSRYWDFDHYRKEQWRLAGERLEERVRGS